MINKKNIPALRVSITNACNLKCKYCPPNSSENFGIFTSLLSIKELTQMIEVSNLVGVRNYHITGGEPLTNKLRLTKVLDTLSKLKNVKYVSLTTNGTTLKEDLHYLSKYPLSELKISLDTLNKEKFKEITGVDGLKLVINGIKKVLSLKIPVRINTVVTKKNINEIKNFIELCKKLNINLKLLDLNYYDDVGKNYWLKNFESLENIEKELSKVDSSISTVKAKGGFGIPMKKYFIENIYVLVKNSKRGATYCQVCKNCKYYPKNVKDKRFYCQEGLYELGLTSDGKLKICRHRTDLNICLKNLSKKQIQKAFKKVFQEFYSKII